MYAAALCLDGPTLANLELLEGSNGEAEGSLLAALDTCASPGTAPYPALPCHPIVIPFPFPQPLLSYRICLWLLSAHLPCLPITIPCLLEGLAFASA